MFEAQGRVPAAVGLSGRVGLAVGSEGALGATNDTFNQVRGHSGAATLRMLDTVFFHGGTGPLKALLGSWLDDRGGVTGVTWHRVGAGIVLTVSNVGVWYLKASLWGEAQPSEGVS